MGRWYIRSTPSGWVDRDGRVALRRTWLLSYSLLLVLLCRTHGKREQSTTH